MKFSITKLLAVTAAVASTSVAAATSVAERETDVAHILLATGWTDSERDGSLLAIDPASPKTNCTNLDSPFKKNLSSIEVFNGVVCDFYVDNNCTGDSFAARNLYIKSLDYTEFNNAISSYACRTL